VVFKTHSSKTNVLAAKVSKIIIVNKLIAQYWFLLGLAACFATGFWLHERLHPLAAHAMLRDGVIALCMFLMALPLEARAIGKTLRRPAAIVLAVLTSFLLLPLAARILQPLLTPDYAGGLLVAAVTPCTMASATVWTRKAGGNDIAATVVTVVTNLLCFFVTPCWLWLFTGSSTTDWGEARLMVVRLFITVALPVVAAQLLRLSSPVAEFSLRRKEALGITSQLCILLMVLIGAIKTGQKLSTQTASGDAVAELALMVAVVLGLHFLMFWIGLALAKMCGLNRADQIAVGFAGSQKTLMVGMNVSIHQGFSVLPMITYHVGQLFIDTILADWLKRNEPILPHEIAPQKND
jgi:solute carrier family 10 (sodium/bile acid cotransporter), member 7